MSVELDEEAGASVSMNLLIGVPGGLLMIGMLVVIHEFGHFLFARLFGIGTPVFSVGIGHRIWGFQFKGTDFRLSALPFGGYVQMSGVDPFGEEDPDQVYCPPEQNFMNKPVWQRLVVMAAGPVFNLLLPIPLFVLVLMAGQPEYDAVVGQVVPGTPAAEAGIRGGDKLVSIAGEPMDVWEDITRMGDTLADREVEVVVDREGETLAFQLPKGAFQLTFDGEVDEERVGLMHMRNSTRVGIDDRSSPAARAGLKTGDLVRRVDGEKVLTWDDMIAALVPGVSHKVEIARLVADGGVLDADADNESGDGVEELVVHLDPGKWDAPADDPIVDRTWGFVPIQVYVEKVVEDSPAEGSGIQDGDRLFAVDGAVVRSWSELTWLVQATVDVQGADAEPRAMQLTVVRDGERLDHTFTPMLQREVIRGEPRYRPIMGVLAYSARFVSGDTTVHRYTFGEAVPLATTHTALTVRKVFRILGHLMTGGLKPKESVGGPVAMLQMATQAAEYGFWQMVQLAALISVSLGIMNLLPVPVLDGGHIVFYAIEGLRGRPLPLALRERIQMVGVLVLSVVMLLVLVMDVARWLEQGV